MEKCILSEYLGWSAWILLLIPLVLFVRLVSRRSRWSVARILLMTVIGIAVASLRLNYAGTVMHEGGGVLGGKLGAFLSRRLDGATENPVNSFIISTFLLFLWGLGALMDAVIATARFYINKPYVREVVREVVKEVEVPKTVQERKRRQPSNPRPSRTEGGGQDTGGQQRKEISSLDEAPDYRIPATTLLRDGSEGHHEVSRSEIEHNIAVIKETPADHHVQVSDIEAVPGPTVTLYKVFPAKGVRVSSIQNLSDDVSVALKSGKILSSLLDDCAGMEVANRQRSAVSMRELLESREFRDSGASLPVAIGRKVTGEVKVFDLADAPHLLVAGATGQGKFVGLNVLVASLLYAKRPSELKLVFIDPKKTEFGRYSRLYSHYLALTPDAESKEDEKARSIVKNAKGTDRVLRSLCQEMSERYDLLEQSLS